jgi:hypothetical protein
MGSDMGADAIAAALGRSPAGRSPMPRSGSKALYQPPRGQSSTQQTKEAGLLGERSSSRSWSPSPIRSASWFLATVIVSARAASADRCHAGRRCRRYGLWARPWNFCLVPGHRFV